MYVQTSISLLCLLAAMHVSCIRVTVFFETKTIVNTCDRSRIVKEYEVKRNMKCALSCIAHSNCWRYKHCSKTSMCTLYTDGTDCIIPEARDDCSCFKKAKTCEEGSCTCSLGYYGKYCQKIITDCTDGTIREIVPPTNEGMLTTIQPDESSEPFDVTCVLNYGGFLTILHRDSTCQIENFNRSLAEYENGFGEVYWNQWIGFNRVMEIMRLENSGFKLNIMIFYTDDWMYCESFYPSFMITYNYGRYEINGTFKTNTNVPQCGDSLFGAKSLQGNPFSTYDSDHTGNNACAKRFGGGWWFDNDVGCTSSFFMATMGGDGSRNLWLEGLVGNSTIQRVQMRLQRNS